MKTETLTLSTPDGDMKAYWAEPDERTGRAIIVVQEAFGVTGHIEDICRRLADAGFAAIAPHLFHRADDPIFSYDNLDDALKLTGTLTADGLSDDIAAANALLRERGYAPTATGIIGFCMGGIVSFFADTEVSFGAAATLYGGGIKQGRFGLPGLLELAPKLRAPWLGCYGDLDKGIPTEEVEALREVTAGLAIETQIVRYPNAGHGFNCDARPAMFEPDSAKDAWARALEWFDKHLIAS